MIQFDEARRNDPATRELVKAMLARKSAALQQAEAALVEACEVTTGAVSYELMQESSLALFGEARAGIFKALREVRRALDGGSSETYIGNLAASRVGAILQAEAGQQEQA